MILDEIDHLEGLRPQSRTKREEQFRHSPLHPLWHKHYSAPRHFLKNIDIRWNLAGDGNRDLTHMLHDVAKTHGEYLDRWPGIVAHRLVVDGYKDRSERGLTGDWIVFGKHAGQNYYLDLATHREGADDPERLYWKLRWAVPQHSRFYFSDCANFAREARPRSGLISRPRYRISSHTSKMISARGTGEYLWW